MNSTFLLFSYLTPLEPSKNFNISKIVYYICIIFCSLVRAVLHVVNYGNYPSFYEGVQIGQQGPI